MSEIKNYTYRMVVKPWYPCITIQRAELGSIGFDDVKWETVTNVASTKLAVKNVLIKEINRIFEE